MLHDHVRAALVVGEEVRHFNDVLMTDGVDRSRLVEESIEHRLVERHIALESFDGNFATQFNMNAAKDLSHASLPELPGDSVAT
jgi:hypothetical protein